MTEQSLDIQNKKEIEEKGEKTVPGKYYVPYTDIYETADKLVVVMEVPGVERKDIDIRLEKSELTVDARVDFGKYKRYKPVYTEYNVGHFTRSFALSSEINKERIGATLKDGVLTLDLPKIKEAAARKIEIAGT